MSPRRPPSTAAVIRATLLTGGAVLMVAPIVWAALS
jgi:hypothetical protein